MKELRRGSDGEAFEDVEKAKNYYEITDEELLYDENVKEFNCELKACQTLEEIATVWNKYTDLIMDGTELVVKEL